MSSKRVVGRSKDAVVRRFCCQDAEKMRQLTDPFASVSENFCGVCAVCKRDEPYTYHVPEAIWRKIVPKEHWNAVVCAACFDALARRNRTSDNTNRSKWRTEKLMRCGWVVGRDGMLYPPNPGGQIAANTKGTIE